MSKISFIHIDMHGHINPTLPVVAELVRRGHEITYQAGEEFGDEVAATGAQVETYPQTRSRQEIRPNRSR